MLASGIPEGAHRVELYRRSETQTGYTQFLGYDFEGGTLLPPPLPAPHRIEFVGDSQPAGFGIEGVGPDCPGPDWAAQYENFHRSLSARLGEILDADLSEGEVITAHHHHDDVWHEAREIPHAPLADFTAAVRGLVATFRAHSPQAYVFLALSPSVSDEAPATTMSRTNLKVAFDAIASEHAAAGDGRLYSVAPPVAAESELTGCDGHGSPAYHERVAQQLAVMVKARTGW